MSGYFEDPAATARAFAGGWFHSGDLAVWHPYGTIELRDRGKDIIISGGENISSIEVEQAITAHSAVLGCAFIGIPHPHWGERPKAFVTLNHGAAATAAEIIAFRRERLAHNKSPDAIEFGPLPNTSTGRIQKFVLRDRERARHRHADRRYLTPGTCAGAVVPLEPPTPKAPAHEPASSGPERPFRTPSAICLPITATVRNGGDARAR